MGALFLVSTPIGNLADITLRAIDTLWSVEVILCEDTRETKKILAKYINFKKHHQPRLMSYTDYNCNQRIAEIVPLLNQGQDVALVADRGTPLISDPGYRLVKAVLKQIDQGSQIEIEAIPGPSVILPALQLSGFPMDKFMFIGFLPKKASARKKLLHTLPDITKVAFESPFRLIRTLRDLLFIKGDIQVAVCREITKLNQQVFRGQISEVLKHYSEEKHLKGEITLVF